MNRTITETHLVELRRSCANKVDKDGYRIIHIPGHPLAWRDGWLYEHRLVAHTSRGGHEGVADLVACSYCGYLVPWRSPMGMKYCVNVDHINCNRLDNSSVNLRIACYACNNARKLEPVDKFVFHDFCRSFGEVHPVDRPNPRDFFEEQLRNIRRVQSRPHRQPILVSDALLNGLFIYERACPWTPYLHTNPITELLKLTGSTWNRAEKSTGDDEYIGRWTRVDSESRSGIREVWRSAVVVDCAVTLRQFPALSKSNNHPLSAVEFAAVLLGTSFEDVGRRIDFGVYPFYHQRPPGADEREEWNRLAGEEIERLIGESREPAC